MTVRAFVHDAFNRRLWVTVLVAIVAGGALGLSAPEFGASLEPLGSGFIALIKMLIAPIVFCTIVTGIASAGSLASVGRVGAKAMLYFQVASFLALLTGFAVMNIFKPGAALDADPASLTLSASAEQYVESSEGVSFVNVLTGIIPDTLVSAFVDGKVLQVLLVSVMFAIAVTMLGERGEPIVRGVEKLGEAIFGLVKLVMYLSPLGAFGAMAYTTGEFGVETLISLSQFVLLFALTTIAFCLVVFGAFARLCGLSFVKIFRYFKDEALITLGTASYEAVLPKLLTKLQQLGAPKRIVGLVVPAGYSFNADGICLYVGFATLYIAQAFGIELSIWEQVTLLLVAMLTSNGAAGIAGTGFVILAATLSVTNTVPIVGIMLILGVDRFLSIIRAMASLSGQIMGSLIVARWEGELDVAYTRKVLAGEIQPAVIDAGSLNSRSGEASKPAGEPASSRRDVE